MRIVRIFALTIMRIMRIMYLQGGGHMKSSEVLQRLRQEGFEQVGQRGSHIKMRHPDGRTTIIPHPKKDLPKGTLKAIEKQANISL